MEVNRSFFYNSKPEVDHYIPLARGIIREKSEKSSNVDDIIARGKEDIIDITKDDQNLYARYCGPLY